METTKKQTPFCWLALGNSLTRHGLTSFWWNDVGMAATTAERDYVHQVSAYLRARYGDIITETFNFADWERGTPDVPHGRREKLGQLDGYLSGRPDLITIQLSENALDTSTFAEDTVDLLRYLREKAPQADLVLIDDFWSEEKSELKRKAADVCGVPFVSLRGMRSDASYLCGMGTTVYDAAGLPHTVDHPGVAAHPGDKGMRFMAERIIETLETL